jgi:hypothetical protein
VADLLGWDWKTKAFYRQVLGAVLFGNQKLFTPSVRQAGVRRLLYYVDDVAQTLEQYASSGRRVTLEIVPLFSPYDWPSRRFSYTWGGLLGSYSAGQFRELPSPPPRVRIKVVDFRDMVHAWFPVDSDYATLFYRAEQHYSTRGKARLALAWAITAGYQGPPGSASDLAAPSPREPVNRLDQECVLDALTEQVAQVAAVDFESVSRLRHLHNENQPYRFSAGLLTGLNRRTDAAPPLRVERVCCAHLVPAPLGRQDRGAGSATQ